ncbi:hypothetical protein EWM64_g3910 [Hericium alpestre]|uniref:Uncharacterized protein n=1 Tax=Hericium alpestre TaxID=135208 RepID=A0A4Z0A1P9_9AGAM|nr:hypothetical protein EWM64_g3910 [Hericium alpestre]
MSSPAPSDFSIHLVKELTDAQIDEAVALSVRSFGQAFVVKAITGGNKDLSGLFFRSIIAAGADSGAVYFANDKLTGGIIGVGVWFGPGHITDHPLP